MRLPSPAPSENEVDIAGSLFQGENPAGSSVEGNAGENFPDLEDSGSDDAGFIAESLNAANRKASNLKGKSVKKGGGFQAMGLNANLLKAITRKGFSVPTPIQRKTIPMVLDGQDVVAMARTGSGKTAAFVIPLVQSLVGHSAKMGSRALIMSPSRELALQTLKVVKELCRGTDLRCVLVVGGDSLEEQFDMMSGNADIVIATPGRFLHLKVEMNLDISAMRYVVFDEADRLFEMGFAAQLAEILHALPQSRQTLLFSATLPKSLVEFARAGLQEPHLIRLDSEAKISPDLQSAFFTIKSSDKEGALLSVLSDLIKIETGKITPASERKIEVSDASKKRKRGAVEGGKASDPPAENSTIIFTCTKHHVEYIATLLRQSGYAVSHVYGSLDQIARKGQIQDFRSGKTNILVTTDVAARGIDIPILANVINYDFPAQPKVFVHRVGRTARAGNRGWSYSLVQEASDCPYLLDLQLFLGKPLVLGRQSVHAPNFAETTVVGSFERDDLARNCEWAGKLLDEDSDLRALRGVAAKGEKLYLRTRNSASSESVRRAKEIASTQSWMATNPLFREKDDDVESKRTDMLSRIGGFRPSESVFEVGKKAQGGAAAEIMRKRRLTIDPRRKAKDSAKQERDEAKSAESPQETNPDGMSPGGDDSDPQIDIDMDSASETELQITFPSTDQDSHNHNRRRTKDRNNNKNNKDVDFKSSEFFMPYTPTATNLAEDRAYGVHSGGSSNPGRNFLSAARDAAMDLTTDDGGGVGGRPGQGEPSRMRWDKKQKKYVLRANDEDGSRTKDGAPGKRLIRGESGQKIAASFRSGRFEAWKRSNRIGRLPRVGEAEKEGATRPPGGKGADAAGKRYRHRSERAPKEADRYRDDFHKKRKLVEKAKEERRGRFKDGVGGKKGELRGVDAVRKERRETEKRRDKSSGGKKGRGRGRG